ncbi:MAG: hypothetical protein ACLQU2_20015 [Candidatus Binataceae bacterium]
MVEQVVVGIDVSKAKLDVALLPGGEQFLRSTTSRACASVSDGLSVGGF